MGHRTLTGNPPIDITLRRSGRARRISLRVSSLDGRVTLTLPPRAREAEALDFARSREGWIRAQLDRQAAPRGIAAGAVVPVGGALLTVTPAPTRGPRRDDDRLLVAVGRAPGPQVLAWLKEEARRDLTAASRRHAATLGEPFGRITLRDTRSRWGSCSSGRDLMYSWRLILAPCEVLDYVAAHEVAHLRHMDHSPAYWATVAGLMPDYAARRDWLRRNGAQLHAWRFDG